jgi:putative addiction module component (TIGR02574 family)
MNKIPLSEILKLTISERLELVERIWDSLGAEPEDTPLSDEARAELDRRIALVEATPGIEPSWAEERARLGIVE